MLEFPRAEPTRWVTQLERPQKITRLLKVGSDHEDLMDQVLHTYDTEFAQVLLNKSIVGERNTLFVNFAVAALVDEITDSFEGGVAVGDVGFDYFEHLGGGFCKADEDAIVDLKETEELENFAGFGGDFVDTGWRGIVSKVEFQ